MECECALSRPFALLSVKRALGYSSREHVASILHITIPEMHHNNVSA